MIQATSPLRARSGFTLVELMVGAAIVVIIMTVLATCFQLATDTMREMKATGDLASQLRGAETVIRHDLEAPHFLPDSVRPNGRLSEQNLDNLKVIGTAGSYRLDGWIPPPSGFFKICSAPIDNIANFDEGADADGLRSSRATNHFLHFTSIQPDAVDSQPYTASVGAQQYKSRAAEIALFLDPIPSTSTGGSSPLPLHRLIRRQRLVALNDGYLGSLTVDDAVISTRLESGVSKINTLQTITNPDNRLGRSRTAVPSVGTGLDWAFAPLSSTQRIGEDVLLSNVISFEVRAIWSTAYPGSSNLPYVRKPTDFGAMHPTSGVTWTDYPFDAFPPVPATAGPNVPPNEPAHSAGNPTYANAINQNRYVFDTWNVLPKVDPNTGQLTAAELLNCPPLLIRIQALQIRIRVWDSSTQTTRQITIVQEM